jgi:hypothetical protein
MFFMYIKGEGRGGRVELRESKVRGWGLANLVLILANSSYTHTYIHTLAH